MVSRSTEVAAVPRSSWFRSSASASLDVMIELDVIELSYRA
jgi:hypothetical protein